MPRSAALSGTTRGRPPNGRPHPRRRIATDRLPVPVGLSFAVAAGEPVADVDPIARDTQCEESFALDGQVLLLGGAPGVIPMSSAGMTHLQYLAGPARRCPVTGNGGNRCIRFTARARRSSARAEINPAHRAGRRRPAQDRLPASGVPAAVRRPGCGCCTPGCCGRRWCGGYA